MHCLSPDVPAAEASLMTQCLSTHHARSWRLPRAAAWTSTVRTVSRRTVASIMACSFFVCTLGILATLQRTTYHALGLRTNLKAIISLLASFQFSAVTLSHAAEYFEISCFKFQLTTLLIRGCAVLLHTCTMHIAATIISGLHAASLPRLLGWHHPPDIDVTPRLLAFH
jgi:hypothetical protein